MRAGRSVSGPCRRGGGRRGTVLMESVLVLPLLLMLIFAIVQFALVWYAQVMTHYAAYNAARAALVYHPEEYGAKDAEGNLVFRRYEGVCHEAACQTLAWVAAAPDGGADARGVYGWGEIPNASHISRQVRIDAKESRDGCLEGDTSIPAVRVRVDFDYPLHVPVVGRMLAYFAQRVEREAPSRYDVVGWTAQAEGEARLDALRHPAMGTDYLTLHAYCVLPKPWSTRRFARRPPNAGRQQEEGTP